MNLRTTMVCTALLALGAMAHAADASVSGQRLYASCAGCHGSNGQAVGTTLPELAGQPKDRIVAAMRAFKSGTRDATIMHQIAKGYTDEQIEQIAAFLATQPATSKK